jgi:hypothetical protein
LAAAGILHANSFADGELVNIRPEGGDRAHIFMAGGEVLVEGQAAQNARGRPAMDDFKVGCADRDGVDPDQNLRASRDRRGLVAQEKLVRVARTQAFI